MLESESEQTPLLGDVRQAGHEEDASRFLWTFGAAFQANELISNSDQSITISLTRSPLRKERAVPTRESSIWRYRRRKRARSNGAASCRQVVAASPGAHVPLTGHRLERPDENGGGVALPIGHRVKAPVNPVVEVDVRDTGRPVQRVVARRASDRGRGMGGRVVGTGVGLGLDDTARRVISPGFRYQQTAEQIGCDVCRGPAVEARFEGSATVRAGRRRAAGMERCATRNQRLYPSHDGPVPAGSERA